MSQRDRLLASFGAILLVLFAVVGFGASPTQSSAPAVDVVQVDLERLIDAAVKDRNRFAVDIPRAVDASQAGTGTWSVTGGVATWRYSVRVPTAVSLSFHAANIFLPPSAQLKVLAGGSTNVYSAKDTYKRQLWSRISKGDSLAIELTVAPSQRRAVVLQIASVQAGYRGFGQAVPDHPHYRLLRQQASAASTSSCIVNYECDVTAANTAPGQATVALIIGNAFQCSGTLINDVSHDGKPYVLTARHCENGQLGGGNPAAAANVVVYWDATSPCGSALGTLYDPGIVTQQGATTVVEQQDAWLLLLSQPPAARKHAGYNRQFRDSYHPNASFYLLPTERARLAEIGKPSFAAAAPGTYAKQVLNRLLIDLSWNSSRLEGNTYSLLDTKRLIEFGEEAQGRDRLEAQMIMNHKDAIEFLVSAADEIGFNRYTILNLHGILAQNLLQDEGAAGAHSGEVGHRFR